jgi:hypothetical protein
MGMFTRYLIGEYTGDSRDVKKVLTKVEPHVHVDNKGLRHVKCILMQGFPSCLVYEEKSANTLAAIQKSNQHTFLQHPEVVTKTMNKEEKYSHVLPL